MLKISEMAKLANTTRRTLIFYDQENIFKPIDRSPAGYRYYDYSQLYDLMFILGLRGLDIPLDEIRKIGTKSQDVPNEQLISTQNQIDNKINELVKIREIINKKIGNQSVVDKDMLYQPSIQRRQKKIFWCSQRSVSCTEEEVAQLFAAFYKQLDSLAVMDTTKSGFLTNLTVDKPNGYAEASFRVIKEVINGEHKVPVPTIEKNAGRYVCTLVENNVVGIDQGLTELKIFCKKNKIVTEDYLWQINAGNNLIETGSSKYGWLEFAVLNKQD
ncbi:MerR family transcriptional regulator [Lactobacillus sp. UCMA15818]|uniref:MerR family transcriptional regulator n=1 Tax=Lactobacillaceae TaxID=33958 RepID=UPI0025AF2126|nr:MerR family transcriptional regulator [Lactobacillus sp. UCMA15818]MDN2453398.1 MerR family transcriptional regulator [Lactobacillus sp. UCMA15818]